MEYIEIIVSKDEVVDRGVEPDIVQRVNDKYEIWYFKKERVPPLSIQQYSYSVIPKCLMPLSNEALQDSGVLKLQNNPTLSLKGQGVFIAIIDTGVQITDNYNIYSIWDQNGMQNPPEGFFYGTEYRDGQIDELYTGDSDGHGTYVASVAAGKTDLQNDFTGAAPEAELIVVKLRPASEMLKEFYYIPNDRVVYSEADIMLAVAYADKIATRENRPLVICLALGCNNGLHVGSGALSDYLSSIATKIHRAVVIGAGNEANQRKHYSAITDSVLVSDKVEIEVTNQMRGFYIEFWSPAPDLYAVSLQSPTGAVRPQSMPVAGVSGEYEYAVDDSRAIIDYRYVGRNRRDQLISIRIDNPSKGIWTLLVYTQNNINGSFNIWLPMKPMMYADVNFIRPNPNSTFTMPGDSKVAMTVGGYNQITNALYLDSGRGFAPDGGVKPDFLAPAVEIKGLGLRGQYISVTGTSAATAITAGACAQLLEWAVVRENAIGINSVDIKNLLIRGTRKSDNISYPNEEYGYGIMDVYESFRLI